MGGVRVISALLRGLWRLAGVLQRLVALLLLVALLVGGAALLYRRFHPLPEAVVLDLRIHGELREQAAPPAPVLFPSDLPVAGQTAIPDIVRALDRAAADPRIRAVWLDVETMEPVPLARIDAVAEAIDRFRSSGKPVVAYGASFSTAQYLLATSADRIVLHPTGVVALAGPAVLRHYFKSALDRLSLRATVVRAGRYKSFAEPVTREGMSDAAREAARAWLEEWWRQIKRRIAARRGIDAQRMQHLLDHPRKLAVLSHGDLAALARRERLVDLLGDRRDARRLLQRLLHRDAPLPWVESAEYLAATDRDAGGDGPTVALIRASGEIVPGKQPVSAIGARTLTDLIERAARDDSIAAVVLRIDSPGGSATAAETIHRALLRLKRRGKPLVVSMGGVAASGGYWIASAADEIWARPATLTGSIGVFALIPDLSPALEQAGIHLDGVQTTALLPIRGDRPLDAGQRALLEAGVAHIYDLFLQRVAEGRHLPRAQVERLAQGRVWSGVDALRLHLVDHLGGLGQAIAAAARRVGAHGDHYRVRTLHPEEEMWQRLAGRLLGRVAAALPTPPREVEWLLRLLWNGPWRAALSPDPRGIYAYAEL